MHLLEINRQQHYSHTNVKDIFIFSFNKHIINFIKNFNLCDNLLFLKVNCKLIKEILQFFNHSVFQLHAHLINVVDTLFFSELAYLKLTRLLKFNF